MLTGQEQLYVSQGGDGTPVSLDEVAAFASANAAPASTATAGVVKAAAHQPAAAGANPTKAEYDALLAALVAAGVMAAS